MSSRSNTSCCYYCNEAMERLEKWVNAGVGVTTLRNNIIDLIEEYRAS